MHFNQRRCDGNLLIPDPKLRRHSTTTKGLGETGFAQELVDYTDVHECKKIEKIYLSPDCFGDSSHSRACRMGNIFAEHEMPRAGWPYLHLGQ
jgi:hypothetical protein